MHYTTELLINNDKNILGYYEKAKAEWKKIIQENEACSSDELAKILTRKQMWFEQNCGSRWVGQEIMVVTGITQFYSTNIGFDKQKEKALWVYKAFMKSYCSMEVKGIAEDIAKDYNLIEENSYAF